MATFLHRHQGWIGALALIIGFSIAATPTFAPPLAVIDPEPQIGAGAEAGVGVNYVRENVAMRELRIAELRLKAYDEFDSAARREARALLPALERELGQLRCLQ